MRRNFVGPDSKVVTEREISVSGYPGREVVVEAPKDAEGFTLVYRVYWSSPRLITTGFMTRTNKNFSENRQKVLDSLKLLTQ